jgi:hypothetical protein
MSLAPAGRPRHTWVMGQEHDDYADPDADPLPIPSMRVFLLTLAVLAVLVAVWFYVAVVIPGAAC